MTAVGEQTINMYMAVFPKILIIATRHTASVVARSSGIVLGSVAFREFLKIVGGNYDMREIILCGDRATQSETKVDDFDWMKIEIMTAQINLIAAILVALLDSNIVFPIIVGCQQSLTDIREISFGWVTLLPL